MRKILENIQETIDELDCGAIQSEEALTDIRTQLGLFAEVRDNEDLEEENV